MGKKWITLLFIVLFGTIAMVAHAGPYMVVVLDVEKGGVNAVYDSMDTGNMDKNGVVFKAKPVQEQVLKKEKLIFNGKRIEAIADYTVIRTHSSPGCTTYTYQGYTWTVCN